MDTTPEESCPICERAAKVGRNALDEELVVDCRTCGDYSMGEDAPVVLRAILKRVPNARRLISYCIRQAQHSNKRPLIDHAILMALADHNILPAPPEQGDNLIRVVGDELRNSDPAAIRSVDPADIVAVIGASSAEGVYDVAKELQQAGILKLRAPYGEKGQLSLGLTFSGWKRYSELQRAHSEGLIAFMAMPLTASFLMKHTANASNPRFNKLGSNCGDSTTSRPPVSFDVRMEVEIRRSRFLVAELTNENRGVYWEAGFAEGLGKPVIYTCESSYFEKERSHFDINHRQTIVWSEGDLRKAGEALKTTIRATLPSEAKMFDDG